MDMKTVKEKLSNLWETKGYILVVVLCIAVLGGTALATRAADKPEELADAPEETYEARRIAATNAPSAQPLPTPTPAQDTAQAGAQAQVKKPELIAPAEGTYGMRYAMDTLVYHATTDKWATHTGLDVQANEGEAVRAVMAGEVTRVSEDPVDGVCIAIRHNNGMTSCYLGLKDATEVQTGDAVTAGQIIGRVGVMPSERDEGPHLHFELLEGNGWLDPEGYLNPLNK